MEVEQAEGLEALPIDRSENGNEGDWLPAGCL